MFWNVGEFRKNEEQHARNQERNQKYSVFLPIKNVQTGVGAFWQNGVIMWQPDSDQQTAESSPTPDHKVGQPTTGRLNKVE